MTLRLDIPANGAHAPYFAALARGYYRQAGLDLTRIGDGAGSIVTAEDVAAGHDTFGVASADSAAGVISKGAHIRVVADFFQTSPAAVIFLASTPIHKPTDLYGKRVGSTPGTAIGQMWQAFMAANHLNPSRVTTVNTSIASQIPALRQHRVDAVVNFAFDFVARLDHVGVKTGELDMSRYGVHTLTSGIVTSDATLKRHPQWVRAFVAATIRGFRFAQAHPRQAVALEHRYRTQVGGTGTATPASVAVDQLKRALKLLHTPASAHDPIGYMTAADWRATLQTAHLYEGMKTVLPLADYYTNAFLPSSS